MQAGWYILNYHNVDYEDSLMTQAIGGTTRPDVFASHVKHMTRQGPFISIEEGQERLDRGQGFDRPYFSLWFDDGFAGVRTYALPVCQRYGIRAALSICSRFVTRTEMFWRAKLSLLAAADGLRFVRASLRRSFPDVPYRLKAWSLDNFCPQLLEVIDHYYEELTTPQFRHDAFRLFENAEGIQELVDAGWTVVNHSAAHYPLSPGLSWEFVKAEFDACDRLVQAFQGQPRYWVLPFDVGFGAFREPLLKAATPVRVGNRPNTERSWRSGILFRYFPPETRAFAL